jgi:hypothetical protein
VGDEVGAQLIEALGCGGFDEAARKGNRGAGRPALSLADETARLLVGDVRDGAAVDDDGVGAGGFVGDPPAGRLQMAREGF